MVKQDIRNSLIENIESALKKDADNIDPDFIDRLIDELYTLDRLPPPTLTDKALDAAARSIRARAAWRQRNRAAKGASKRRVTAKAVRWTLAACSAALISFSVNYITALATGVCFPSRVGIKICCGTQFCLCDTDKMEETGRP
jgi:hypothetical protein